MNNFNQIIVVKFEGIWRAVVGCAINPYTDNAYVQYILNGKVYECRNVNCWRFIGHCHLDDYERYAMDYNNGALENIIERKKAEIKVAGPNARPLDREILKEMIYEHEQQKDEMNHLVIGIA